MSGLRRRVAWRFALSLALACGHAAPAAPTAADRAHELLETALANALASLAPGEASRALPPFELPAALVPGLRALRGVGLGARVDAFEAALDHAARLSLAASREPLTSAVREFSPPDAEALLASAPGSLSAALLTARGSELRVVLAARSEAAAQEAGLPEALSPLREGAGRLPLPRSLDADLVSLVTERALQLLSLALVENEKAIRAEREAAGGGYGAPVTAGPLPGAAEEGGSR